MPDMKWFYIPLCLLVALLLGIGTVTAYLYDRYDLVPTGQQTEYHDKVIKLTEALEDRQDAQESILKTHQAHLSALNKATRSIQGQLQDIEQHIHFLKETDKSTDQSLDGLIEIDTKLRQMIEMTNERINRK